MKTKDMPLGYMAFLSTVAAVGGLLFGYDTAVISGTIGQVTRLFRLDPMQQGWYVGCALIGSIVGVLFAGVLSDRWGRKPVMILSAVMFSVSGIWCAASAGFSHLVAARMLGGVAIGVVSIVSPLYISEISEARCRGRFVSLYQVAVTIGFLGAYIVNYYLLAYSQSGTTFGSGWIQKILITESWRGMLGMESVPALIFLAVIFFIPESPRWLIAARKEGKARKVLARICDTQQKIERQLSDTRSVLAQESRTHWSLLFRPGTLRAVVIGACIAMLGQFMGVNAVLYYGPSIFENAGLSGGDSLFYQVLVGLVNTVTSVLALLVIDKIGRKRLIYYGVSGMIASLLLIGGYFMAGQSLNISSIALLFFFLAYIFFCAGSISAVIFVLLSEMYPTRIRGLAMSIAGLSLWVGTYLIGQLTPWMLETLMPAGTFILFAAMCVPYLLIVWKMMPETAGKTLEEIELFWKRRRSFTRKDMEFPQKKTDF